MNEEQTERPGKGGTVPPMEHRWKPGQSGNPSGSRKKPLFTPLLRELLESEDQVLAKTLVMSLFRQACQGNRTAINVIMNRIDGGRTPITKASDPDAAEEEEG